MGSRIHINDVFQNSLYSAYKQGFSTYGPPAAAISGYGSHGIGFVSKPANSSLVLLDAVPYLLTPDGNAKPAPPGTTVPFVMVTNFQPASRAVVPADASLGLKDLGAVFSSGGADTGGQNSMMPFKMRASFSSLTIGEHVLNDIKGTIFGFTIPTWAQGISGPTGVRCCFYSDEAQGSSRKGGLVTDFKTVGKVAVEWSQSPHVHLGLPSGEHWQSLQLD